MNNIKALNEALNNVIVMGILNGGIIFFLLLIFKFTKLEPGELFTLKNVKKEEEEFKPEREKNELDRFAENFLQFLEFFLIQTVFLMLFHGVNYLYFSLFKYIVFVGGFPIVYKILFFQKLERDSVTNRSIKRWLIYAGFIALITQIDKVHHIF